MTAKKPELLWGHFEALSRIPRGSGNEAAAGDYVLQWAKRAGLQARRDGVGNVLVKVPATKGMENAAATILQGHLDMVCEKDSGAAHDFARDPIRLREEGGYVLATGTTLGADNGIGVSAALAVAEDTKSAHGSLELLFTVDEETGLKGAMNLSPGLLEGRRLLNLDTEEDGCIYIGCAGGQDTLLKFQFMRAPSRPMMKAFRLAVYGLRGGHSGADIHEGRGNANQLLGRALFDWDARGIHYGLAGVEGGSKRNAIPREANAVVLLGATAARKAKQALGEMEAAFRAELKGLDDGVMLSLEPYPRRIPPFSEASRKKVVALMASIPHGVLGMSRDIPGLVETSTNFAIMSTNKGYIEFVTSQRSSVASRKVAAVRAVAAAGALWGVKASHSDGYPGWKPDPASPLLDRAKRVYLSLRGKEPTVKAIHAGLECGLIGERFPGMQMISFGPTIENAHSPAERVDVASVERFYDYLLALLDDLGRDGA